ncbi:MAG: FAD-dependent oxidoreductase [Planctomycetota bacterium]
MRSELKELEGSFDLLIIGGGISGAWTALDAAKRGLRTALVEQSDFASGTSSASSKLIHGGLRYLEHFHLGVVRRSLQERALLMRLAPHRVKPLRFALPLYDTSRVSSLTLMAGLTLYDALAGFPKGQGYRRYSREQLLSSYPYLNPDQLVGGFSYLDAQTDDARLTLELALGAAEAGAVVASRVKASGFLREGSRVIGARCVDGLSGDAFDIRAAITLSATGPWARPGSAGCRADGVRLTKGVHLVLPSLETDHATLLMAGQDGRIFFLIPWHGSTLVGTTDTLWRGDPSSVEVLEEDVDYLLKEAGSKLRRPFERSQVRGSFAGVRVLREADKKSESSLSREWELLGPEPGLFTTVGGKLTAAREEARLAVDAMVKAGGLTCRPCSTHSQPFPWAPSAPWKPWRAERVAELAEAGLDAASAGIAVSRYGTKVRHFLQIIKDDSGLAARIHPAEPYVLGDLLMAARHERALSLEDALRRRLPLSLLRPLSRDILERASALMGRELGWDTPRRESEVATLLCP